MKSISLVLLLALLSFQAFARPMSEWELDNQNRLRRQELERQVQVPQPPGQQASPAQQQQMTPEQRVQALEQRVQALERELREAIQEALVFEREALAFERRALAFEQEALAFEQRVLAFEQQALAFEREVHATIEQALVFEREALAFEQRALTFEQRALAFEQEAYIFERETDIAIQQAMSTAQQALSAAQQILGAQQIPALGQQVAAPAQPGAIVPKSLTITGITEDLVDRADLGLLVGVFPSGTSLDYVINDLAVYLNYLGYLWGDEMIERVIAGADPTDPLSGASAWGTFNNYSGSVPLLTLFGDDFVFWTDSGIYDVWVASTDGYSGYIYQARNITFATTTTTVPAANFSMLYSEDIRPYVAGIAPSARPAPTPAPALAPTPTPPPAPAPVVYRIDPNSLTITGITEELVDQGALGLLVGVFPSGTSQDYVINDINVYLNYLGLSSGNEVIQRVVAGADPTDPLAEVNAWGTFNNYSGSVPLVTLLGDNFVFWTDSGTYDVWVGLSDGSVGHLYRSMDVAFGTATTTVPASNFAWRLSQALD